MSHEIHVTMVLNEANMTLMLITKGDITAIIVMTVMREKIFVAILVNDDLMIPVVNDTMTRRPTMKLCHRVNSPLQEILEILDGQHQYQLHNGPHLIVGLHHLIPHTKRHQLIHLSYLVQSTTWLIFIRTTFRIFQSRDLQPVHHILFTPTDVFRATHSFTLIFLIICFFHYFNCFKIFFFSKCV